MELGDLVRVKDKTSYTTLKDEGKNRHKHFGLVGIVEMLAHKDGKTLVLVASKDETRMVEIQDIEEIVRVKH